MSLILGLPAIHTSDKAKTATCQSTSGKTWKRSAQSWCDKDLEDVLALYALRPIQI